MSSLNLEAQGHSSQSQVAFSFLGIVLSDLAGKTHFYVEREVKSSQQSTSCIKHRYNDDCAAVHVQWLGRQVNRRRHHQVIETGVTEVRCR